MRKKIIPIVLLLALGLGSCTNPGHLTPDDYDRASWTAFCQSRGYDAQRAATDESTVNEYLDCWSGSAAEEQALARLGFAVR